jgi:hypothetical protein
MLGNFNIFVELHEENLVPVRLGEIRLEPTERDVRLG